MLFQALDDKKECIGIYLNNKFIFNEIPENLTKTWAYSTYLSGRKIEYASIYANGASLTDACPEDLKKEWENRKHKLKAFSMSFKEAKVSLKDNCYFDLIPVKFLEEYCQTKNKITQHILDTYPRPEQYEFFSRFQELLEDIKYRELNIDFEPIKTKLVNKVGHDQFNKLNNKTNIIFNMYGSITGRLVTEEKSFPIQNFAKSFREILKPKNDWFVVLDVNGAELRTSLGLLGKTQPEEDIYEWISKSAFDNKFTRAQTKDIVIPWLYNSSNPASKDASEKLDELFQKAALKEKHWNGTEITTPFNRVIKADEHHAISYLNQSTFIDLFHRQVIKVDDLLKTKKSFISFMLHDELVLDMADDEKDLILDTIKLLQDTQYGKFPVSVKVGKTYGSLKKINLKA